MDINELKKKNKKELFGLLQDNKEKLRQLRFDLISGKVKNIKEIKQLKKEIAIISTILNSKKDKNG